MCLDIVRSGCYLCCCRAIHSEVVPELLGPVLAVFVERMVAVAPHPLEDLLEVGPRVALPTDTDWTELPRVQPVVHHLADGGVYHLVLG